MFRLSYIFYEDVVYEYPSKPPSLLRRTSITSWTNTGRTQANILRKMKTKHVSPKYGVSANLTTGTSKT